MPTRKVKSGDTLGGIAKEFGVGVDAISGYRSGDPNLIYPDEVLQINSPQAAAAAVPPTNPQSELDALLTGGGGDTPRPDSGFNFTFGSDQGIDSVIGDLLNEAGSNATKTIDEDEIRRNTLALFQDQIDATNVIYDDLLADTRHRNADRTGGGRALRFAQGLQGSARGAAQGEKIEDLNEGQVRAVQAERAAAVGAILGKVRESTLAQLQEERLAKQQGAESYLNLIRVQDERKSENINGVISSLVSQGLSFDDLSSNEVTELTKNLRVTPQELQTAYMDATKETRAAEQKSTREAAIVSLYSQGITDAATLFDYLNYDEQGNRIGDVSLEEVKGVVDGLKVDPDENTFTLGQGQAKYRVNPDGSVEQVAYNPKTYAPSDDGFDSGVDVLSFDEWKQTDTAKQLLNEEQQNKRQSIADPDAFLQPLYQEAVAAAQASAPLKKLTNTDKGDLQQAGLSTADPQTQSYFLNAPAAFRGYYKQQVALGNASPNADAAEIDELYQLWDEERNAEGEDDLDTLIEALRNGS